MKGAWARVVGVLVLGSEGVVEGGDVMVVVVVVVVLVVGDCIEEGIFFNVLLGSGGWRGILDGIFIFLEEMGWEGMCMYILADMGCIYIYIYIYIKLCASIENGRFVADPVNGSYFGAKYSIFLWIRESKFFIYC